MRGHFILSVHNIYHYNVIIHLNYPKLKEYYSSIKSYVEFFTSPSGSFKQLADTINTYENGIRTLESDVGFLFSK